MIDNDSAQVYNHGAINNKWDVLTGSRHLISETTDRTLKITAKTDHLEITGSGSSSSSFCFFTIASTKAATRFDAKKYTFNLTVDFADAYQRFGTALCLFPTSPTSASNNGGFDFVSGWNSSTVQASLRNTFANAIVLRISDLGSATPASVEISNLAYTFSVLSNYYIVVLAMCERAFYGNPYRINAINVTYT